MDIKHQIIDLLQRANYHQMKCIYEFIKSLTQSL